uniref:Uncharacterized protein n=1 Tax=Glossina morsitans morsitans TaxID=37546 RepID=A0A1B0FRJ1_GLOMM
MKPPGLPLKLDISLSERLDSNGRSVVHLRFVQGYLKHKPLDRTRQNVLSQFLRNEMRLQHPNIKIIYDDALKECEIPSHMENI